MSLPCPTELSNIEIEDAHTPVPRMGSGSSPTSDIVARSPRREHSGRGGFVTLKRKGSSDIVRHTHARSASLGSCNAADNGFGGTTPKESLAYEPPNLPADNDCADPLCTNTSSHTSANAHPSTSSSGGGGTDRRGSWGGSVSTIVSLEDAAQRIAVDPDSGHSYFVERPTVCDACPYCEDVCEVAWCNGCDERRIHLEETYGPLMLSTSESEGIKGGLPSPATLYAREEGDAGGGAGGDSRTTRNRYNSARPMAPVLSRRYPRKTSYTLCEVRRRKLTGACWIVSQGSVYDVTGALADHPGGKRSVLRNAGGKDCSEDFFFHSKAAKKQWRQYRIGSLVSCNGEGGGGGQGDGERSMRTGSDCVIC